MGTTLFKAMKNPVFARHETFHPRYGWLKKGFSKVEQDDLLFTQDNASVTLGVGKNMVKAIKYWGLAFNVLDEERIPGNKGSAHYPSQLGIKLLKDDGWDPYLEDLASLWLLHWNLLRSGNATAWFFAFNIYNKQVFSTEELLTALIEYNARQYPTFKVSESSLLRDINCLVRMYIEQTSQKVMREDSIDCPFSELGLIKNYADAKHYSFISGPKPGLVPEMIVAACLEYAAEVEQSAKTISTSRLLYDQGSPGQGFKLTESQLCDAIEHVSKTCKDISISEQAGLLQLIYNEEPRKIADEILNSYYALR